MTADDPERWADRAEREFLDRILRSRPPTVEAARALLPAGVDLQRTLARLGAWGYVAVDGDRLDLTAPDRVVAENAAALLRSEAANVRDVIALLDILPELSRSWELGGSPEGQAIQGEVIEGDENALRRWYTLTSRLTPNNPGASHPDLSFIHEQIVPNLDRMRDEFRTKGFAIRYLFPSSALESADDRAAIEACLSLGAPVRVTASLPSWFYVDRGVMAGLPQTWGATSPGGMVMVYSTPIVEALSWLFESMWATARPVPLDTYGWAPVLALLASGKTDGQIATILDIGIRTVRRRIAEAMDDFGVQTRFELGAAWARHGS